MARIPRSLTVIPNFSVHKIWRGHNKEFNIQRSEHKEKYLEFMNEDLEKNAHRKGSDLHALTLMSNHTHEVSNVLHQPNFSGHMRRHHARYGAYFNSEMNRSGKVAEDRPKTCLLGSDFHEMRAIFYVHANPLRANIVRDPSLYRWSTHRLYAYGKREPWMKHIVFPNWYLRLGKTMRLRQRKYRSLFDKYLRETSGKKARPLNNRFYGPTSWIKERQEKIQAWRKLHDPPFP